VGKRRGIILKKVKAIARFNLIFHRLKVNEEVLSAIKDTNKTGKLEFNSIMGNLDEMIEAYEESLE
jgi:hypothetical protein